MLFNSLDYLFFLPLVFILYFSLPGKYRWIMLLAAGYYFYMCWRAEYIFLILLSTCVDFFCAKNIEKNRVNPLFKNLWVAVSLSINLGILFTFKYYNFFTTSLTDAFSFMNIKVLFPNFDLLLPVGISFYTFQSVSYTIDVYRNSMKAETNFGYFALYVSFFPQLVAGPIERAYHLLPQLKKENKFNYDLAVSGAKTIALGFFKKVLIADRLALFVNPVFNNPSAYEGFPIVIATIFFAIQIYCDFSGYSDIAIGSARIMGFNLMQNFNKPYWASSISDFWRRWHISLNSWFVDYIYSPIVTARRSWGLYAVLFAILCTFTLSGLWHGAKWTFVIWGVLHAFAICYDQLTKKQRKKWSKKIPSVIYKTVSIFLTFSFVCLTYIFFRANSVEDAFNIIFNATHIHPSQLGWYMFQTNIEDIELKLVLVFFILLLVLEAAEMKFGDLNSKLKKWPFAGRYAFYCAVAFIIILFGHFEKDQFIYFQF